MNCSKCGSNESYLTVGVGKEYRVCGLCVKLYARMTESLRLEYVEKLKETENFFFNGGKKIEDMKSIFIDDEELYEQKTELEPVITVADEDISLPQELFG
jgi:hypothetical protein